MDLKMVKTNQKRANKQQHPTNNKTKKKLGGPLRVVYITNPIKFNATASEFRALVQELTGQDSDLPESDRFTAVSGGGVVDKVAAAAAEEEDYKDIHHLQVGAVDKMGHNREEGSQNGSDPLFGFGSYDDDNSNNNNEDVDDDGFCGGIGMDSFEEGLMMGSSSSSSFWINEGAHYLDDAFKR